MSTRIYSGTDAQGTTKKATSNEFYVAAALKSVGLEFQFQLSISGGRQMSGGIVLDFLVLTTPLPTPVWVHGEHWHQGNRRANDIKAMQTVETVMAGQSNPGVEIWGSESSDAELAMNAVRRKIL